MFFFLKFKNLWVFFFSSKNLCFFFSKIRYHDDEEKQLYINPKLFSIPNEIVDSPNIVVLDGKRVYTIYIVNFIKTSIYQNFFKHWSLFEDTKSIYYGEISQHGLSSELNLLNTQHSITCLVYGWANINFEFSTINYKFTFIEILFFCSNYNYFEKYIFKYLNETDTKYEHRSKEFCSILRIV